MSSENINESWAAMFFFSCMFLHQGGKWSITGTVALFSRSWARQAFSSVWRDSVWLKVNQIRPLAKQTRRHHLGTDKEAFIKRKLTMLTKTCSLYQRTGGQIGWNSKMNSRVIILKTAPARCSVAVGCQPRFMFFCFSVPIQHVEGIAKQ